jgi:hypothetical protein
MNAEQKQISKILLHSVVKVSLGVSDELTVSKNDAFSSSKNASDIDRKVSVIIRQLQGKLLDKMEGR